MDSDPKVSRASKRGSATVEQVVLVVTVALVFVAALIPVGAVLFDYHGAIEFILALPVP